MPDVSPVPPSRQRGARSWVWMAPAVLLSAALAAAQPVPVTPSAEPPAADAAQALGAQPVAPPVQAVGFTTPAGALLVSILPAKTGDFEFLLDLYVQALATSQDEAVRALAPGWRAYKAGEPVPGGTNVLYVILVDPAVAGADYSWQAILSTIVAAFPDKQQDVFEKGTSVHAGPMNKLTLTRVPAPRP